MTLYIPIATVTDPTDEALRLPLPQLPDVDAMRWMPDALTHATSARTGVVVVGEKGCGKSVALAHAIETAKETETTKRSANAGYRWLRFGLVDTLPSTTPREVIFEIWRQVVKGQPAVKIGPRGKTDGELLIELVQRLLARRYAVIAFDEAEFFSPAAHRVIRDLMSLSYSRSKEKKSDAGLLPAGLGVLLVGASDLEPTIVDSPEANVRWSRMAPVSALAPDQVPDVYRRLLPEMDALATLMGADVWGRMIHTEVTRGGQLPIGVVVTHVRTFHWRLRATLAANDAAVTAAIEQDAEVKRDLYQRLFDLTLSQMRFGPRFHRPHAQAA
jgi:hypothetical protein